MWSLPNKFLAWGRFTLFALLFYVLVIFVSCGEMERKTEFVLVPSHELESVTNGSQTWIYRKPDLVLAAYDKVMLDPVVLQFHPQSTEKGIYPQAVQRLADQHAEIFHRELAKEYQVVKEAGPRVLLLRTAFSNMTVFSPKHWSLDSHEFSLAAPAPFHLGNRFELNLVDVQSNDRLITVVEEKEVDLFNQPLWSEVRDQLSYWAKNTRKHLRSAAQVR